MATRLVVSIRWHDRFHGHALGKPEWPPSPARLFQAFVAGASRGHGLGAEDIRALEWLECLAPPEIAAPRGILGQQVSLWVPNNDADTLDDPRDVSKLRTRKVVQPRILQHDDPLHYAWVIGQESPLAGTILGIAEKLYQLGRGVDLAWARGEVMDEASWLDLIDRHEGSVHRPSAVASDHVLPCPVRGSLASLEARFRAQRFEQDDGQLVFHNSPKPRFATVSYGESTRKLLFELRDASNETAMQGWPLPRIVMLTERLRDGAAARLTEHMGDRREEVASAMIGKRADGSFSGTAADRVRIVPLPSIGHQHVDMAVRRFLVEVPGSCPLSMADTAWAFLGLASHASSEASAAGFVVTRAGDRAMLARYEDSAREWHSITPVALPESASRRRIEPLRQREEAKPAPERSAEEQRAMDAVRDALRHAGVRTGPIEIRVQREPWQARGSRAEAFAEGTRFAKERLWHVRIRFDREVRGPLVVGDGRFLGLGVFAPVPRAPAILGFRVQHAAASSDESAGLVRAMRRCVMARVQQHMGRRKGSLPTYFTGHAEDGSPARSADSNHIAIQWDGETSCLLVIPPHVLDRRAPSREEQVLLELLTAAMEGIEELVAGRAGRFRVASVDVDSLPSCSGAATRWVSATPYTVTRHAKGGATDLAVAGDVLEECSRRGLPRPSVRVLRATGIRGKGLTAEVELEFEVSVRAPLVLGRTRYLGGGLFRPA